MLEKLANRSTERLVNKSAMSVSNLTHVDCVDLWENRLAMLANSFVD